MEQILDRRAQAVPGKPPDAIAAQVEVLLEQGNALVNDDWSIWLTDGRRR